MLPVLFPAFARLPVIILPLFMKNSFFARAGAAASLVALACAAWNPVPRAYSQEKTNRTLSATKRASAIHQVSLLENFRRSLSPSQRKLPIPLLLAKTNSSRLRAALPQIVSGSQAQALQAPQKVIIYGEMTPRIKAAIQREGKLTGFFPESGVATAVLGTAALEHIATATEVHSIIFDPGRLTNRSSRPIGLSKAAWNKLCVGSLNSEGDKTHLSEQVRAAVKFSGKGIKVGVISDSASKDRVDKLRALGDLPDDVQVLTGQAGEGSDEGAAMMEIVHDIAPDAKIEFATAGDSPNQMAKNILDLQKDGCNIIVDDITFGAEAVYQEDVISAAVRKVATSGVIYLSSAGNFGNRSIAATGAWDGTFTDGDKTDDGSLIFHSWNGDPEEIGNLVTQGGGTVLLKWADAVGRSGNDYNLYLFNNNSQLKYASTITQDGDDQAIEGAPGAVPGDFIVVARRAGSKIRPMRMNIFSDSATLNYSLGPTGTGHNISEFAVSVGASPASDPFTDGAPKGPFPKAFSADSKIEPFSSTGPRTLYFTPSGDTQTRLIQKPDITAADGVSCVTPHFNPFFGTSAAAPHAAALAALYWSSDLKLTADTVRKRLLSSTIDIGAPGYDNSSGNGIVMADKLFAIDVTTPTATPKPTPTATTKPTPGPTATPTTKPTATPVPASAVAFTEPTYSVKENAGTATISVRRIVNGNGASSGVSVKYQTTTEGTAAASKDYRAVTGTLTWAAGDSTVKTFTIPIVDDNVRERDETVNLRLYDVTKPGTILSSRQTAVLTIADNETGTIESTPPTVVISSPRDGSRVSNVNVITGTANDQGGSQLASVVLYIQRPSDKFYWDGSSWVRTATALSTTLTNNTWRRTDGNPPQSALYEDFLVIIAVASDGVGNTGRTTSRFFVDPSAPQVFINSPSTNSRLRALSTVEGTVSDTGGDSKVILYLQRAKDNKYYTGSGFGNKTALSVTLEESGEWSRGGFPKLDAGDYVLTAVATDDVGNKSTSTVLFTITSTVKSGSGNDS